jgi:PleD family two-component response regulator
LPRIFDRFSQQDATTTRSHGGLGATFIVRIALIHRESTLQLSDSQTRRTINFSGVTALVVEEDADTRELTRRILTDVGATVVEASSAEAAFACVRWIRKH